MIRKQTIKLLLLIFALAMATPVLATQLDFVSETTEINVSQKFWVDIMVDTQDETINAISGTISYPQDKLKLISQHAQIIQYGKLCRVFPRHHADNGRFL